IRLLEKVSPNQAGKLPRDSDIAIKTRGVKRLIGDIREIFESEPLIAERMLEELESQDPLSIDVKRYRLLKSLIKMYQGANSRYLNFYGPPGTITTVPYYQVMQSREKSAANQKELDLNGKTVFVGISERLRPEQKDSFHTAFSQSSGLGISGVEIMATAFANLLEDMPVRPLGFGGYLATIFLWGMLLGIFCRLFPTVISAVGVMGMSALFLIAAQYNFKNTGSWYPLVIPLFFQAPLAFFGALAIEHFRLLKQTLEKLRMEKDLSMARDVQT
ncbi:unnamed protein product, partial [marine sediment metagenome]